jgi:uncharacterized OB-fold protein
MTVDALIADDRDEVVPIVAKPIPQPDSVSAPFWEGCALHHLLVQRCDDCTRYAYPPRLQCTHCGSARVQFAEVSGRATLHSFAILRQAFHIGFLSSLPIVLATVAIEEDPAAILVTNVVGVDLADLRIGMDLMVEFEDREGATVPVFGARGSRASA